MGKAVRPRRKDERKQTQRAERARTIYTQEENTGPIMLDRRIKRILAYLYSHSYHRPEHIKPEEASSISHRTFSPVLYSCSPDGKRSWKNSLMPFAASNSAKRCLIAFGLVYIQQKKLPPVSDRRAPRSEPTSTCVLEMAGTTRTRTRTELDNGNSNSSRPTQVSNLEDLACREGDDRSTIRLVGLRVFHPNGICFKRITKMIERST